MVFSEAPMSTEDAVLLSDIPADAQDSSSEFCSHCLISQGLGPSFGRLFASFPRLSKLTVFLPGNFPPRLCSPK